MVQGKNSRHVNAIESCSCVREDLWEHAIAVDINGSKTVACNFNKIYGEGEKNPPKLSRDNQTFMSKNR